jgi:3-methyladenine DNA glycosylase AlkD
LDAYQRGEIQATGQLFSSNCSQDCEQHVTDALASYERAVIKATGRALTEASIAHPEWFARAEMQAQGQILLETSLLACGAGDWVSA